MFNFGLRNSEKVVQLRTLAIVGLIITAFGYAILGLNSRLLAKGFSPATQVYVRITAGFILSLIVFGKKIRPKEIQRISKSDWLWLVVMGTIGYSIGVWFITLANLNAKLVNSAVIYGSIPFVVYLYSFFLLKEKVRPKLILFLLVAILGIGIIASKSLLPNFSAFGIGELFAFLSVLASGWWSVGRKKLSNHLNNKEITIITMMIAAATGLMLSVIRGESLMLDAFTIPVVLLGIAIGGGLNLMLTFLENFSFQHIDVVLGNQLLMLSTLFALLNGFIFYQELISLPELVGAVLILLSVWQANKLLSQK